jgi:hypothetical protein
MVCSKKNFTLTFLSYDMQHIKSIAYQFSYISCSEKINIRHSSYLAKKVSFIQSFQYTLFVHVTWLLEKGGALFASVSKSTLPCIPHKK